MYPKYWIRFGDAGDYHSADTIQEVAEEFKENHISFVERHCLYGVKSNEFQGNNYISLFTGTDPSGLMIREIPDEDLRILNQAIQSSEK